MNFDKSSMRTELNSRHLTRQNSASSRPSTSGSAHRMGFRAHSPVLDAAQIQVFMRNRHGSVNSLSSLDTTQSRPGSVTSAAGRSYMQGRHKLIVAPKNASGGRPVPLPLASRKSTDTVTRPRSQYIGQLVFAVDESVYIGGIEAANNANLLCRLNIEYVVDVSNVQHSELPKNKRSDCPCLCSKETKHTRATLAMAIEENATQNLINNFHQCNEFIDKAKLNKKAVLIHSYRGTNRAVVFALQYLMSENRLGVSAAECLLREQGIKNMQVSDNLRRQLREHELALANARPCAFSVRSNSSPFVRGLQADNATGYSNKHSNESHRTSHAHASTSLLNAHAQQHQMTHQRTNASQIISNLARKAWQ